MCLDLDGIYHVFTFWVSICHSVCHYKFPSMPSYSEASGSFAENQKITFVRKVFQVMEVHGEPSDSG